MCLLTKETIDKFINTFIGVPVIIDHKDNITADDINGRIQNIWFSPEDGWYWCSGIITNEKAIELIEDGYNVSCQYAITQYIDNLENKLHNGNPYDKEILNGLAEHLAIVKTPRYEGAFIAANAFIAKNAICQNEFKEADHPRDEGGKFTDGNDSQDKDHITDWGQSYPDFSNKPSEAIEHLLKNKQGYLPAAISKEGIGDIDFVYGKGGKKGFGLAHIIEQRDKQGINGKEFVKNIPQIIQKGELVSKDNHADRKYIISDDKEVAIRLDYSGQKRNWIVTAYITKELQGSNSLEDWHTMLAHDSNLNAANGYVSITAPAINSITKSTTDFNPMDYINKLDKGGQMTEDMKEFCAKIANAFMKAKNENDKEDEKDDKTAKNEDVDKRKLIDEIDGILKGKVDEELWQTIIGKAEKIAYDKSSAGTADNSQAKNEDEDDEDEKKAKNKKAANQEVDKRDLIRQIMAIAGKYEDSEDVRTIAKLAEKLAYDKSEAGAVDNKAKNKCKNEDDDKEGEYEELKEKIYEEVKNQIAKNSMDALKSAFYQDSAPKEKLYISQKEGIELGKQIYG